MENCLVQKYAVQDLVEWSLMTTTENSSPLLMCKSVYVYLVFTMEHMKSSNSSLPCTYKQTIALRKQFEYCYKCV